MFEKTRKRISDLFYTTVKIEVPDAQEATSRDPKQTAVKRIGYANVTTSGGSSSRQNFEAPSFDLSVIDSAYDTEPYIKQAIEKYLDLIFKAGWEFKGKNQKSLDYIKLRLAVMAEATDTPTNALLKEIADAVLKYANAFIIKARAKGNATKIPGLNISGIGGKQPVAGYFSLTPSTIQIARDQNGTVLQYQQIVSGQNQPFYIKPEDMIHIAWKRPIGNAYGVPFLLSVLDDVRLLREIEDNVANLLYKYLHPLYKFIVGLQEDGKESTPEEIEYVKEMIQNMPMDGTLVLPERYDVQVVGAEGSAIDASWALNYFELRVFTGLGIPETVFGRASTANRSTAENLTVEMHDRVRALQVFLADEINFRIIKELLMEGGFDPVLRPEDDVQFSFNEIAIDELIKKRNQAIYEYEHNAVSFDEMRHMLGMDPTVDENQMFMNRVTIPVAQATADAKIAAQTGTPATNNKQKPTNQYGTKTSPKKVAASDEQPGMIESFNSLKIGEYHSKLMEDYRSLRHDVIEAIRAQKEDQIDLYINIVSERMKNQARQCIDSSFAQGLIDCKEDCEVSRDSLISSATRQSLYSIANDNIDRILNSIKALVQESSKQKTITDKITHITSSFSVNEYRLNLMSEYHSRLSYNIAYCLAAIDYERYELMSVEKYNYCDVCHQKSERVIKLSKGLSLAELITKLPPWHHGCDCYVRIKR